MNTATRVARPQELRHGLEALRGNWLWFVLLGVVLILLGLVALGSMVVASLATAMTIGALLLIGGMAETVGAFWCRAWSGFFFHLLSGLLAIVVGFMFLRAPLGALLVMTMLLACLLLVGGIFRLVAAITYRFTGWGWTLAAGVIDVILGGMILAEWPEASLWVIGMFVGISLLVRGANWAGLGLGLRSLPRGRVESSNPSAAGIA